jgi:hypothetical protein
MMLVISFSCIELRANPGSFDVTGLTIDILFSYAVFLWKNVWSGSLMVLAC